MQEIAEAVHVAWRRQLVRARSLKPPQGFFVAESLLIGFLGRDHVENRAGMPRFACLIYLFRLQLVHRGARSLPSAAGPGFSVPLTHAPASQMPLSGLAHQVNRALSSPSRDGVR